MLSRGRLGHAVHGRRRSGAHLHIRALLASENRYRSLIETTGTLLVGISRDGTIFEWNREADRVHGCPRADAMGLAYSGKGRFIVNTVVPNGRVVVINRMNVLRLTVQDDNA